MNTFPIISRNACWWRRSGSNRRPPACKAGALPAELRPLSIGSCAATKKWWAWVDLNYRPHAYQACALTKLSYRPRIPAGMFSVQTRPIPITECHTGTIGANPSCLCPNLEGIRRRQRAAFVRSTETEENFSVHILRKEVIQPQVPLRLPCYDFTPVADPTVAGCLLS